MPGAARRSATGSSRRSIPRPAGAVSAGFAAQGDIYDVSAYWALAGGAVTSFDEPIDLTLTNGAGTVVPAFLNGSAWQPIPRVDGTSLPGSAQRGFYKDGDTVHVLTRGTGSFTLLRDLAKPKKPKSFKGKNASGRLVLSWKALDRQQRPRRRLPRLRQRHASARPSRGRSFRPTWAPSL